MHVNPTTALIVAFRLSFHAVTDFNGDQQPFELVWLLLSYERLAWWTRKLELMGAHLLPHAFHSDPPAIASIGIFP